MPCPRFLFVTVLLAAMGIFRTSAEIPPEVRNLAWEIALEPDADPAVAVPPLRLLSADQTCTVSQQSVSNWTVRCEVLRRNARAWPIHVTWDVIRTREGWRVSGSVVNEARGWRVCEVEGPRFDGLPVEPGTSRLYIPDGLGRCVTVFPSEGQTKVPRGWIKESDGETFSFYTAFYPGHALTMPWLALDGTASGVYVGCHDPLNRAKRFRFRWLPGQGRAGLSVCHKFFLPAGEKRDLPETVLKGYSGDWHAATAFYRAWYDTIRPVRVGSPDWTRRFSGWLLVIMKQQNEELFWPYTDIDKICDYADKTGLDCIGLFGWTVGGHDHLYPDYDPDPKMGGAAELKKGIRLAQRRGKRVCLYANGQLQQVGATRFWEEHGRRISLENEDGTRVIQHYHKYNDIPAYDFALGCLYAPAWGERMGALARQAEIFGADGILFDQLGMFAPFACYGHGHGHPVPSMSYESERPDFLRRITDEMRRVNPDFAVLTEGLHDTILDSVDIFHGCETGTYPWILPEITARAADPSAAGAFPELFRYTFPELVTTTRVPAPIATRTMVSYSALYGFRHDIELRYAPDRVYAETGKIPSRKDYGTVRDVPSQGAVAVAPAAVQTAYLKAVNLFQRRNEKYLLGGRFVDTDGFSFSAKGCLAKRFTAADGTSAVCVWNPGTMPAAVRIDGLGRPLSAEEPEAGTVVPTTSVPPATLRLYCFGK